MKGKSVCREADEDEVTTIKMPEGTPYLSREVGQRGKIVGVTLTNPFLPFSSETALRTELKPVNQQSR